MTGRPQAPPGGGVPPAPSSRAALPPPPLHSRGAPQPSTSPPPPFAPIGRATASSAPLSQAPLPSLPPPSALAGGSPFGRGPASPTRNRSSAWDSSQGGPTGGPPSSVVGSTGTDPSARPRASASAVDAAGASTATGRSGSSADSTRQVNSSSGPGATGAPGPRLPSGRPSNQSAAGAPSLPAPRSLASLPPIVHRGIDNEGSSAHAHAPGQREWGLNQSLPAWGPPSASHAPATAPQPSRAPWPRRPDVRPPQSGAMSHGKSIGWGMPRAQAVGDSAQSSHGAAAPQSSPPSRSWMDEPVDTREHWEGEEVRLERAHEERARIRAAERDHQTLERQNRQLNPLVRPPQSEPLSTHAAGSGGRLSSSRRPSIPDPRLKDHMRERQLNSQVLPLQSRPATNEPIATHAAGSGGHLSGSHRPSIPDPRLGRPGDAPNQPEMNSLGPMGQAGSWSAAGRQSNQNRELLPSQLGGPRSLPSRPPQPTQPPQPPQSSKSVQPSQQSKQLKEPSRQSAIEPSLPPGGDLAAKGSSPRNAEQQHQQPHHLSSQPQSQPMPHLSQPRPLGQPDHRRTIRRPPDGMPGSLPASVGSGFRPMKVSRAQGAKVGGVESSTGRQPSRQPSSGSLTGAPGPQSTSRGGQQRPLVPSLPNLGNKAVAGVTTGASTATGVSQGGAQPPRGVQPGRKSQPNRPSSSTLPSHGSSQMQHPPTTLRHGPVPPSETLVSHGQERDPLARQHVPVAADQQQQFRQGVGHPAAGQPNVGRPAQLPQLEASGGQGHGHVAPPLPAPPQPPQPPQPAPSAEDNGLGEGGGQARRQLKVEDALHYLEQVKFQFSGRPTVYNHFLDIMKEFKAQTIDTAEVIKRVSQLFYGHKDLILGFNTFLPPGYKIEVREDQKSGIVSTGFCGPRGVFSELHPQGDLVEASGSMPTARSLTGNLPGAKGNVPSGGAHVVGAPASSVSPSVASRAPTVPATAKRSNVAAQRRRESKTVSNGTVPGPDAAEATGTTPPAHGATPKTSPPTKSSGEQHGNEAASSRGTGVAGEPQGVPTIATTAAGDEDVSDLPSPVIPRDPGDFEDALVFMSTLKKQLSSHEYDRFLSHARSFMHSPVGFSHLVNELVGVIGVENKDTVADFMRLLPDLSQVSGIASGAPGKRRGPHSRKGLNDGRTRRSAAASARNSGSRGEGSLFFEDVKRELGTNSVLYQEFIKCISLFSMEIISREELVVMASELFKDYEDLRVLFLENLEGLALGFTESEDAGGMDSSASSAGGVVTPQAGAEASAMAQHERYRSKPISEICADSNVTCTTSYKKLPDDFPVLACSGRSALERRTMNDCWVSVTSGSEDYSFKFMRKNVFEDNLFRCEDDRYELDMVIESNASTILKLEPIAATISRLPPSVKERHFLADGALSQINFLAIRRLYGDDGADVVQAVKLNPAQTIPGVLKRLRLKDEQWRRLRSEYNLIWRDVCEKNYHRSLDHRSASFKQVDKKELSSKSLVLDIMDPKASHTARQNEMTRARGYAVASGGGKPNDRSPAADAVAQMAAAGQSGAAPHLELPYEAVELHKVIFSLVSKHEAFSNGRDDGAESALKKYVEFFRLFFGVDVDREGAWDSVKVVSSDDSQSRMPGDVDDARRKELEVSSRIDDVRAVVYGDESMYLFFRYHQIVFERLNAAKDMAEESAKDQAFRKNCDRLGQERVAGKAHMPNLETPPSKLSAEGWMRPAGSSAEKDQSAPFMLNSAIADPRELFAEFLSVLSLFLSNDIDSNKFEERSRVLLGADTYCLFTIDKALAKLVKQVLVVFGPGSVASEFLGLFQKSCAYLKNAMKRGSTQGIENMYNIAAAATLRKLKGSGANLFRFQHVALPNDKSKLGMHVIGSSSCDDDEEKRAEEVSAIDRFLEFDVGFGSKASDSEGVMENESGTDEECKGVGERKRGRSSASVDDSENDLTSDDEGSIRKRVKRSKTFANFIRYVGSSSRGSNGRIVVRNEILCRVGPHRRMVFNEGKCDSVINLDRKRRLSNLELTDADERTKRDRENADSLSVKKFRSFLERSEAKTCP